MKNRKRISRIIWFEDAVVLVVVVLLLVLVVVVLLLVLVVVVVAVASFHNQAKGGGAFCFWQSYNAKRISRKVENALKV